MKKFSQKLRFSRRKDGPSSNDAAAVTIENDDQCRQDNEDDGPNIDYNQPYREELDMAVQAASQAVQSTLGITGGELKKNNKPEELTASVVEKLSAFTKLVQKIANAHPYSKIAWMIISSVVTVAAYSQDVDQNILDLFMTLESTYKFIEDTNEIENHPSYEHILTNLAKQTVECAYFIRDYAKVTNFWIRTGKNLIVKPVKVRVKIYQDAFNRILTDFRNHSILHTEIAVGRILEWNESISETLSLVNLPYASGAGLHTGKKCLPGTRAEILDDIINWVNDIDENCPKLFWLAGPAGVGKSAIAHSVALWFQSIGRLGSFFSFDRNRSTERREKIFSTIARDLADLDIQIKRELVKAVHNATSLQCTTDLHLQWTHLLFGPLQALSETSTGPILVVVDALDESGDPISRQELLNVLAKETSSLPPNIRFLVTSRPEQDIITAFRALQLSGRVRTKMMDSIPEAETKRDILTYFKTNLTDFGDASFGDSQLNRLAELSQGLFQWAYLALQFLRVLGNTAGSTITERYDDLISIQHVDSINDNLDAMYTQILSSLFNTKQARVMTRFRLVIGTILAASEPLSLNSLVALRRGNISSSQRGTDIKAVIQYMGSLLSGIDDPSSTIRPPHLSLREHLPDKERSKDFFIDLSICHEDFAFACLRTMNEGLRFNICGLSNSHQPNADDKDLPARISSRISITLSYSSRFWGLHVSSSAFNPLLATKVEEFLHRDFLHWLEVMSLLRTVHVAARSMSALISWSSGSLHDFVVDGNRFIRLFSDAITLSTPHIYLSALPFCPEKSIIYQTFIQQFPHTLRVASDPIHHWPPSQRSISLLGAVTCICFSHGGNFLAVGLFQGIIKLYDSESFDVLWNKELSENESVEGIQFLSDDKSLVFATPTGIYLLDILTGGVALYNSFQFFFQVAFSPDAKFVATFNPSHFIVWNLETNEQVLNLPFDIDHLPNCHFSFNDGRVLITHFVDIGVQVWDLETGVVLHGPFLPPSHLNTNVAGVSSNGKHIIFTDGFRLIAWNFMDDSIISFDKPHITSLTFSPGGDCVIARSADGALSLHYMDGSELSYETDRGIKRVACSKDGRWLAIRSDKYLVIRELDGGYDSLEPFPVDSSLLDTSSDGKYFIYTSVKESFEIREVQSGQLIRKVSRNVNLTSTRPCFSPMNRYIGDISGQKFVNLYDIDSGTSKRISFDDEKVQIQDIAFSQDEKRLATLSMPRHTIYIWDIDSSKIIETLIIPDPAKSKDYRVFGASSNFRYFAYTTFNGDVALMDHMQSISLELPTREKLSHRVYENFAFSLDEERMVISHGSVVFHINLVTKQFKHRVVRLEEENRVISLRDKRLLMFRRIYIAPSSETLLVEINSIVGYSIWDASSGQHLYSSCADEYPRVFVDGFIPVHHYLFTTTTSNGHARISTLKQKKNNRICFSSDDRHSLQVDHESSAKLREDGWVVTQDDELLFWVPKDYHSTLHVPGLVYTLGKNSIKLDLSSFSHGKVWIACRGI